MREETREANRAVRWVIWWSLAVVAIFLVVGAIIWGGTVASSPLRGQGDAYREKNSADNWTAAQARFEDLYAEVVATDRKITVAAEALATDPEDPTLRTNYTGTVNYCLSVIADYNAEARKYLAGDFRAADLPAQIDGFDTNTDCKEDTK